MVRGRFFRYFQLQAAKQGGGGNEIFLTVFSRCHICFYIKKSLLQNKEHRIFMIQGIISDFTQNRWSKD
jgi:hypothetical protein